MKNWGVKKVNYQRVWLVLLLHLMFSWNLTLHSNDYPNDTILKWEHSKCLYDIYFFMQKEADHIRHGSVKKIMSLSLEDQRISWESIENSNVTNYWKIQEQFSIA